MIHKIGASAFRFLVLAFVSLAAFGPLVIAKANEISVLNLRIDGSTNPPGDRIDLSLVLDRNARDATVEVMAYLVFGDHNQEQVLVSARGDTINKDNKCKFRILQPVFKDGKLVEPFRDLDAGTTSHFRQVRGSIVVPYANLAVPLGKHKLGYEIRLRVNGQPADVVASQLTFVEVSEKTRTEMPVLSQRKVWEARTTIVEGLAWKDGKLAPVRFEQTFTVAKRVCESRSVPVNIVGEFRRDEIKAVSSTLLRSEGFVPKSRRTIYFATNREIILPAGNAESYFGNESVLSIDKMSYGLCVVSVPIHHHALGKLEQPSVKWWFWSETPDPEKHFLVQRFKPSIGFAAFKNALSNDDVLVFVHGYGNTFKDAVLRAAQLNHDLEFSGRVVVFSWPSAGSLLVSLSDHFDLHNSKVELAYNHDEALAQNSHQFLAALLGRLLEEKKPDGSERKVHVIAHSMGNRILLKAIHDLRSSGKITGKGPRLGQIVLAAADIDGTTFSSIGSELIDSCQHINYYFATDDKALLLSRVKHLDKPIGLGPIFDGAKMDTICADGLTSVFEHLGHSYLSESKPMLTDIRLILSLGLPPHDRRPPLGPRVEAIDLSDCFYWTFQTPR